MTHDYTFDLGEHRRPVTTSSPEAQSWFDRGLIWAYCFNHEEAIRCFENAIREDPDCAMAYWGVAFASGPNYNKAWSWFDHADLTSTFDRMRPILEKARQAARDATEAEQALIEAIARRFEHESVPSSQDEFHRLDVGVC